MDDGSTVTVIPQPSKSNTEVPIQEEEQFYSRKDGVPPKIKTLQRVKIEPPSQT